MNWEIVAVIVLLAAYAFYLARLFRIGFCQTRRTSGELSRTGLNLSYVFTSDQEDCDYNLLWRTQLPALEFLRSSDSGEASRSR